MNMLRTAIAAILLTGSVGQAGEYLVKLNAGAMTARGFSELTKSGITVKRTIPEINIVVAEAQADAIKSIQLQADSPVIYAELNSKVHALSLAPQASDPFKQADGLWGMDAINAREGWKLTVGGPEVILAVSDTGTFKSHPDLGPILWQNPGESGKDAAGKDKASNKIDDDGNGFVDDLVGWNFETNTKDPNDNHYHGTHVAGTVGANGLDKGGIAGVSWNVRIMTVKFLGADGSGTEENGIRTILYASNNGAKAVNCSWGSDEYSQAFHDAIEYVKERGTLVIAAAGNDGADSDKLPLYPAGYDNENIISVGATSDRNHTMAGFSNFGAVSVDLAAPGQNIKSSWNPMQSSIRPYWYYTISGTSMAAPHVTGAVGLIYSINHRLKWRQVKQVLMATVTQSPKWHGKAVSGGVLNVGEAVKFAASMK